MLNKLLQESVGRDSQSYGGGRVQIVHLSTVHPSYDTRVFSKASVGAVRAGYQVALMAVGKTEERAGVRIIGLRRYRSRLARVVIGSLRALWRLCGIRGRIVHFHDFELVPLGLLLKCLGWKVVYDVHEDYRQAAFERPYLHVALRVSVSCFVAWMETLAEKFFDGIVTATPAISTRFPNRKVVVARNYPKWAEEFRDHESDGCGGRSGGFAYVGAISELRGIMQMLDALELLKKNREVRLTLIGEFSEKDVFEKAKAHPAWNLVDFMGFQDRTVVHETLSKAVGGLVLFQPGPNHNESGPNKLFEYMASGLPVVASDFPYWREVVEGKNCGLLVDPADPSAIARALEEVVTNEAASTVMGRNGRDAVAKEYNWENESVGVFEMYEQLLLEDDTHKRGRQRI